MRNFGNAVRNYWGEITITPLSGYGLTVNSNAGQSIAIQGASGVAGVLEIAGNGNTLGTNSMFIGQNAVGQSVINARGAQSLIIGINTPGTQLIINSDGHFGFGDGIGTVWGTPTGGSKGANTINVQGNIYINGVAVAAGAGTVGGITAATRTTDNTFTSNTGLTLDPVLQYAIPGAGTYAYKIVVAVTGGAGGFKFVMSNTATQTVGFANAWGYLGSSAVNAGGNTILGYSGMDISTVNSPTLVGTNDSNWIVIEGETTVTSSGTLGLQWAQQSSSVTSTIVKAGSYIQVTRLA